MAEDSLKNSTMNSDTSVFITSPEGGGDVNFNQFPSDRFCNITPLYVSASGVMRILTAVRYGKRYILKCLTERYSKDPVYRAILRKEFEIGIALDHPYIRRTIGFENVEGLGDTIILEYIDGETLECALKNGHVNGSNARTVAKKLAQALDYIHKLQVVHRDIKPSNVLITYAGDNVKLIDFSLSDSDSFVIIKNPAGTQNYMAPELLADAAQASPKTDIYSFGKTLLDLSLSTHDGKLKNLARICAQEDPDRRPASISEIEMPSQKGYKPDAEKRVMDSKSLTYVLTGVIVILVALISYKLFNL